MQVNRSYSFIFTLLKLSFLYFFAHSQLLFSARYMSSCRCSQLTFLQPEISTFGHQNKTNRKKCYNLNIYSPSSVSLSLLPSQTHTQDLHREGKQNTFTTYTNLQDSTCLIKYQLKLPVLPHRRVVLLHNFVCERSIFFKGQQCSAKRSP